MNNYEELIQLFDDTNVYKLKAQIDLKILEAYILIEAIQDLKESCLQNYQFNPFVE